ncbi:RNA pseudouridine synthase [Candidatus Gracilibacteria bacterium]|nr:MAG: RNA pseudouridine synthase [Candidatus Gracilibacteria bacterium]
MKPSNPYTTAHFCVIADPRAVFRTDNFLSVLFPYTSRSGIQKLIEKGRVEVNGTIIKKNNTPLRYKDEVFMRWEVEESILKAENIPLDIIHEDVNFAVINKDAGLTVHPIPGENGKTGTLVNALLYHFKNLGTRDKNKKHTTISQSIINGIERPGLVHRLDRWTSGLILIAKNDNTMYDLQRQLEKRTIHKKYLALVIGKIPEKNGYIESYVGRDPNDRTRMTTQNPVNPKLAKTKFTNRGYFHDKYTLLEVDLLTGRTHQIRIHLASIGHPLVGDEVYGRAKENTLAGEKFGLSRQWLHAWKLDFTLFGKDFSFTAPLKKDLKKMIEGSGVE